jgi:hypothetical protein
MARVDLDYLGACGICCGDYQSARSTLKRISEIGLDAWVTEKESGS